MNQETESHVLEENLLRSNFLFYAQLSASIFLFNLGISWVISEMDSVDIKYRHERCVLRRSGRRQQGKQYVLPQCR